MPNKTLQESSKSGDEGIQSQSCSKVNADIFSVYSGQKLDADILSNPMKQKFHVQLCRSIERFLRRERVRSGKNLSELATNLGMSPVQFRWYEKKGAQIPVFKLYWFVGTYGADAIFRLEIWWMRTSIKLRKKFPSTLEKSNERRLQETSVNSDDSKISSLQAPSTKSSSVQFPPADS